MVTKIVIITGFLGSGKTTYLRRVLQEDRLAGKTTAVIMNESGKISVDSRAVAGMTELKEITDGCLCCTRQSELKQALRDLAGNVEQLYVEATGAANPWDIHDACTDPAIAEQAQLETVVTFVDAGQWLHVVNKRQRKLMELQAKFADYLYINKIDQVQQREIKLIKTLLREINDHAVISSGSFSSLSLPEQPQWHSRKQSFGKDSHAFIDTCTVPLKYPIDRMDLFHWLDQHKQSFWRVKGYVHFAEAPCRFELHYTPGWPSFEMVREKDLSDVLVFIGQNLDKQKIMQDLLKMQQTKGETPWPLGI
ncbi:MAG: GTP-binding protein [Alkalicoccus sp.]|nr:MAG: GTP-binding protein [Alkalicoccus sp.]